MSIQTAREYLASKGLAKAGVRGKFSNAAKVELARALDSGMVFSDFNKQGKIKDEPVRVSKPRTAKTAAAPKAAPGKTEDGLWDLSEPQHEPSELMIRLRKIQSGELVPKIKRVRKENAIKSIDSAGVVIVQSTCREGHNITLCTCMEPKPSDFINAVSHELIVSKHA